MYSAAILAGGQATRFGGLDKGALVVDGRTILDRQLDVLSPLTDDILVVGSGDRPELRLDGRTARYVVDLVAGCGPMGGLHAALMHARERIVFVAACDMPYLDTELVRRLLELAGEADIVVPQTERGYHPLCAVYSRACLDVVTARLAERRLKMRELVDALRTRVVTTLELDAIGDHSRLLANVNTPAEHARLEMLQGYKP